MYRTQQNHYASAPTCTHATPRLIQQSSYLRDALRHEPERPRPLPRHDLARQKQARGRLLGQEPREEMGGSHALCVCVYYI